MRHDTPDTMSILGEVFTPTFSLLFRIFGYKHFDLGPTFGFRCENGEELAGISVSEII